ncbi:MAG: hypothetical protein QOH75_1948 [Actinomycetota bacterium]|nr:hypothetical protein [Actinomycetota bacterium]
MDLADIAAQQEGVFSRAQARAGGYSAFRIRHRIQSGDWVELFDGRVLRSAHTTLSTTSWDHAALLATGHRSVLAGPSASRWWGVDVPWPQPFVIVQVTSRREPSGITVLRDPPADEDVVLRDGVMITSRPRTVVDCLRVLPMRTGSDLLDRVLQQRWITFEDLVFRTHELTGRRGVPKLVGQIRTARPGTRSEAERLMVRLLRRAGITGWRANFPLDGVGVLDLAFLTRRVAIEIDGRAWHSAGDRFQADRRRQNRLVLQGWTVLRFTWEDLTCRPHQVIAQVRAALA